MQRREWCPKITPGTSGTAWWIHFQLDQSAYRFQRIAKHEVDAFTSSEQVADHRKPATLDSLKVKSRPAGFVNPALNFRRFQVSVNFRLDPNQVPCPFEICNTLPEISITHQHTRIQLQPRSLPLQSHHIAVSVSHGCGTLCQSGCSRHGSVGE